MNAYIECIYISELLGVFRGAFCCCLLCAPKRHEERKIRPVSAFFSRIFCLLFFSKSFLALKGLFYFCCVVCDCLPMDDERMIFVLLFIFLVLQTRIAMPSVKQQALRRVSNNPSAKFGYWGWFGGVDSVWSAGTIKKKHAHKTLVVDKHVLRDASPWHSGHHKAPSDIAYHRIAKVIL